MKNRLLMTITGKRINTQSKFMLEYQIYSTEHNRLLNLWRDVVSVKRHFLDIQSTTERDIHKLKADISDMGREMLIACSRMDTNVFTETLIGVSGYTFGASTNSLLDVL